MNELKLHELLVFPQQVIQTIKMKKYQWMNGANPEAVSVSNVVIKRTKRYMDEAPDVGLSHNLLVDSLIKYESKF